MKSTRRMKLYRDQALYRDLGFLLLATGFLLVKVFDQPLQSAALYAPMLVLGLFGGLVTVAHLTIGTLHLFESLGERLGINRGPRY